jgi:hypothetical protein
MIGMSSLLYPDKADIRSIHVIHHDRSRHPDRQGMLVLIRMIQTNDLDDGGTT